MEAERLADSPTDRGAGNHITCYRRTGLRHESLKASRALAATECSRDLKSLVHAPAMAQGMYDC